MTTSTTEHYTQIIGVGRVPAKPATDIQVGDVLVWNFNYKSTVLAIAPRGKTQLTIVEQYHNSNNIYQRNVTKTRLIAISKGQTNA